MSQQRNTNKSQKEKYQPGSGTQYHKEHASHVPDYGANSTDPIAKIYEQEES